MSNNRSQAEDSNIDWLEKSITEEHIKSYEYSDFKNAHQIGNGSFASVVRVNLKTSNRPFAIKTFFNSDKITLKEIVNEVQIFNFFFKGILN